MSGPVSASPASGKKSAYGVMPAPQEASAAPAASPRHPGLAAALGADRGLGGRPASLPKKESDPDQIDQVDTGSVVTDEQRQAAAAAFKAGGYGSVAGALAAGKEQAYGVMPAPPEAPAASPRHPSSAAALGAESGLGGRPASRLKKESDPDQYGGVSEAVEPAASPEQYGGLPSPDSDDENHLPIAPEKDDPQYAGLPASPHDDYGSVFVAIVDDRQSLPPVTPASASGAARADGYGSFAGALATGAQSAPAALEGSPASGEGKLSKEVQVEKLKQLLSEPVSTAWQAKISRSSLEEAGLLRQFARDLGGLPTSYYNDTVLIKAKRDNKVSIKSYDEAAKALRLFLTKNDNQLPSEIKRKDRK